MIHLDSNYLALAAIPGSPQAMQVFAWLNAGEPLRASAIAWAEFECGSLDPADESTVSQLVGEAISVTAADAAGGARLFNLAGCRRGSLADCIIAATALRARASLATANRADFANQVTSNVQPPGTPPIRTPPPEPLTPDPG